MGLEVCSSLFYPKLAADGSRPEEASGGELEANVAAHQRQRRNAVRLDAHVRSVVTVVTPRMDLAYRLFELSS